MSILDVLHLGETYAEVDDQLEQSFDLSFSCALGSEHTCECIDIMRSFISVIDYDSLSQEQRNSLDVRISAASEGCCEGWSDFKNKVKELSDDMKERIKELLERLRAWVVQLRVNAANLRSDFNKETVRLAKIDTRELSWKNKERSFLSPILMVHTGNGHGFSGEGADTSKERSVVEVVGKMIRSGKWAHDKRLLESIADIENFYKQLRQEEQDEDLKQHRQRCGDHNEVGAIYNAIVEYAENQLDAVDENEKALKRLAALNVKDIDGSTLPDSKLTPVQVVRRVTAFMTSLNARRCMHVRTCVSIMRNMK